MHIYTNVALCYILEDNGFKGINMRKFLVSDYDGTFHVDDESIKFNIEK